ncbi:hypothetical protein BRAS3843_670055 [Bradyrhizobium sp. STM 3843]|nr:hypothetical protein BRAS3843_670055 [Bradyrhizobium sp. STM 3843]
MIGFRVHAASNACCVAGLLPTPHDEDATIMHRYLHRLLQYALMPQSLIQILMIGRTAMRDVWQTGRYTLTPMVNILNGRTRMPERDCNGNLAVTSPCQTAP